MEPITELEAEIVQNESDMSISQYSNKMAICEKSIGAHFRCARQIWIFTLESNLYCIHST